MNFIIIDLITFIAGMLLANMIFFIELKGYTNIQTINYLQNSNNIYLSYLFVFILKLIFSFIAIFDRIAENQDFFQKLVAALSCLILSPITFSFFFIFSIGIQFAVCLSLSTNHFQKNTKTRNIVFATMSVFSILFVNFINTRLSKLTLTNQTMNTIFMSALPFQK